ncbi:J domain-containing protein [Pectobacterium aroidearum]|uniref:J domain-containing protein n=1 Tax=Pectobacterium aroidearum TaxID=1201031 RepID=UPI003315D65B
MSWHGSNNFNYSTPPFFNHRYVVVKKGDVYVAVMDDNNYVADGFYHENYLDLINQGFVYWYVLFAQNSSSAIEQTKEYDRQEIYKLQEEIKKLRNNKTNDGSLNTLDPYEVLGFSSGEKPSAEEIKIKKRKLSKVVHPDAGGSLFLMKLINEACSKLGV